MTFPVVTRNLLRFNAFITVVEDCSTGVGNDRVGIEIGHSSTLSILEVRGQSQDL